MKLAYLQIIFSFFNLSDGVKTNDLISFILKKFYIYYIFMKCMHMLGLNPVYHFVCTKYSF